MDILNKFFSRLYCLILFAATACVSDDPEMQQSVSVYVAGAANDLAVYWKDGLLVPLTTAEMSPSHAQSIFVSGTDVYATGNVTSAGVNPVYWKNGVLVTIREIDQRPHTVTYASSISVSGGDVYIASMSCPPYDYCQACLWRNGAPSLLDDRHGARISSIAISESKDVYVASEGYPALLWKNGEVQKLSGEEYGASSYGLFVSGEDVYVAGTVSLNNIYTPCYWKNGERIDLPAGDPHAVAEAIFVSKNDVYVAGNRKTSTGNRATLWKNGVPQDLDSDAAYSTATCLWVFHDDVYVGGIEINDAQIYTAKYWKNGVGVALTNGSTHGYVNSIMVK